MAPTAAKHGWNPNDAPRLDGKVAIVTGATGGLGYETALGLARRGATTILAGRDPDKGARALANIQREVQAAKARFAILDLASLASVASFATAVAGEHGVIDVLVNNAGVMGSPTRKLTADGFEQQIGVNYLGHFALTAHLLDPLCAAPGGGRVISLASLAHRRGALALDDFQSERSYRPMGAYQQSKLAMLVFAIELQRRSERNGWNLRSIAVHPGWARTDIIPNGLGGGAPGLKARLIERVFGLVAQSARDGALPTLYAAMAPAAADPAAATRLWTLSEQLTGVTFALAGGGQARPGARSSGIAST
jgi:NAD(P)-dependent dehydrogenase (short-subunit alcohol dehydrogenase family)